MNDPHPHSPSPLGTSDLTGRRIGDLQILRRLGRGGMADVYVANQLTLGRRVALKVLRRDLVGDANYVERFRREARAAAKLTHPNIVQIYEVGCIGSMHYISQEYVDGVNLRQQLDRNGPLSADQAIAVMQSVAEALATASAEGVTHRDIKPENVMISQRGDIKVADFGLARVTHGEHQNELTQVGMTMGTPLYMSPEQIQGGPVDVRSDLYSLGVTMYHLLAGRPPFEAGTPLALAVKHLHESPPSLAQTRPDGELPDWLIVAVERLMEKSPDKRFASPAALVEYLRRAVQETGPIGDATATLSTRIDATRTLQQLMREEPDPRSIGRALTRFLAVALPLAALAVGFVIGDRQSSADVSQLLKPADIQVERKDSVEEQYLEAVRLSEPEGWRKVAEFHPPEKSEINAAYAFKAGVQLARLYRDRGQYAESKQELKRWLEDPQLSQINRAIALAELQQTQQAAGQPTDETRRELRTTYQNLTPAKRRVFDEVVPRDIAGRL